VAVNCACARPAIRRSHDSILVLRAIRTRRSTRRPAFSFLPQDRPGDPPTSGAREKLIDSAFRLWFKRSYVGVSEICDEAGVQKGSFYHFFRSKTDLGVAVVDEVAHRFHRDVAGRFLEDRETPPLRRLEAVIEHNYQCARERHRDGACLGVPDRKPLGRALDPGRGPARPPQHFLRRVGGSIRTPARRASGRRRPTAARHVCRRPHAAGLCARDDGAREGGERSRPDPRHRPRRAWRPRCRTRRGRRHPQPNRRRSLPDGRRTCPRRAACEVVENHRGLGHRPRQFAHLGVLIVVVPGVVREAPPAEFTDARPERLVGELPVGVSAGDREQMWFQSAA